MKILAALLLSVSLTALPAGAQTVPGADDDQMSEGMGLLQEGTRLLLEGLMQELSPALEDLQSKIDDLNAYHPPEVLPNGDIIIRRKVPLVPEHLDGDSDGEVEL